MFTYERSVRFEDVDAAGIVFFPKFLAYCHEAMEALLAPIDGGYAGLVVDRRLGLPAVRIDADFRTPLRFGDTVRIDVSVERIGTTSCEFSYRLTRSKDGTAVANVHQVVVVCGLDTIASTPVPDDVRRVLEAHLVGS